MPDRSHQRGAETGLDSLVAAIGYDDRQRFEGAVHPPADADAPAGGSACAGNYLAGTGASDSWLPAVRCGALCTMV